MMQFQGKGHSYTITEERTCTSFKLGKAALGE